MKTTHTEKKIGTNIEKVSIFFDTFFCYSKKSNIFVLYNQDAENGD